MSRLVLETNVRLKAEICGIDREQYDKIVAEYKSERDLELRAKGDFKRAIIEDLGFKPEEINITKFKYKFED